MVHLMCSEQLDDVSNLETTNGVEDGLKLLCSQKLENSSLEKRGCVSEDNLAVS